MNHKIHNKYRSHFHGLEPNCYSRKVHGTNVTEPRQKCSTILTTNSNMHKKIVGWISMCLSYGNFIQNVNNKQTQYLKAENRTNKSGILSLHANCRVRIVIENLSVRSVLPLRKLYAIASDKSRTVPRMPGKWHFFGSFNKIIKYSRCAQCENKRLNMNLVQA